MPNCFQLIRKSNVEVGPVTLNQIDTEVCKHLGIPVHDTKYAYYWFDIIGFKLACGKSFDQIQKDLEITLEEVKSNGNHGDVDFQTKLLEINKFLNDNFTSDNWVEIGKR